MFARVHLLALTLMVGLTAIALPEAAHAENRSPSAIWDPSEAAAAAHKDGSRVEVTSKRSETTQVFANPDGTWTSEEYAEPVRARDFAGRWQDVDTSLTQNQDGSLTPKAAPIGLRFSGGGTDPFATAFQGDSAASLKWPNTLPKPTVDGAKATYAEVFPDVDLVVSAHATGFSEVLVLKTPAAAANPAVREIAFDLTSQGVKWESANGALRAVNKAGKTIVGSSQPMMWDSSSVPAEAAKVGGRERSDVRGPAVGAKRAQLPIAVSGLRATLKTDSKLLADPNSKFPLFIDPAIGYTSWTMINGLAPTQSYWNFDKNDCPSGFSTECAKVGYYPDGNETKYRSLFQFSGSQFKGKHVLGSKFTVDLLYSGYSAESATELWKLTGSISSSTTWNSGPTWSTKLTTVSNSSYPAARKASSFASTSLTSAVAAAAPTGAAVVLGLKATDESTGAAWKKFDAKTAKLVVDYNSLPNVPTIPTVDGRATATPRPVIAATTPKLVAGMSDADTETDLVGRFEWEKFNSADSTWSALGSAAQTGRRGGENAEVQITPALLDGGVYRFRARAEDPWSYGGSSGTDLSAWSPWVEFTIDTSGPTVAPTVSSTDFGTDEAQTYGAVGKTGRFTLGPNGIPDVAGFKWGWDSPPVNIAPTQPGQPVTIPATPPPPYRDKPTQGGFLTLYVQSYDQAGTTGPTTSYSFNVGAATPQVAEWKLDEAAGSTTAADATGNGHNAAVTGAGLGYDGRVLKGPSQSAATAAYLNGVDGQIQAAGPTVETTKSFTASAWVRPQDVSSFKTALAINGTTSSAFHIGIYDGKWGIGYKEADTTTAPSAYKADKAARAYVWAYVVGVYDEQTRQLRLYVDGVLSSTLNVPANFNGTSGITIGQAKSQGNSINRLKGSIADVRVWDRVVSAEELAPFAASLVGRWRMDYDHTDATSWGRNLTAAGGTGWTADYQGETESVAAASFDGTGALSTSGGALQTYDSFTVSAWVWAAPGQANCRSVISQQATAVSAFSLGMCSGKWEFTQWQTDANSAANTYVQVPGTYTPESWTHLTGVYDATSKVLKLYVNGVLAGTKATTSVIDTPTPGALLIGRAKYNGAAAFWYSGGIDDVRIYQGVLPDAEIAKLAA